MEPDDYESVEEYREHFAEIGTGGTRYDDYTNGKAAAAEELFEDGEVTQDPEAFAAAARSDYEASGGADAAEAKGRMEAVEDFRVLGFLEDVEFEEDEDSGTTETESEDDEEESPSQVSGTTVDVETGQVTTE